MRKVLWISQLCGYHVVCMCLFVYLFILFVYLFIYCVQNFPCKFISVKVYRHKYLSLNILCNVYVGRMWSWMRCEIGNCHCTDFNTLFWRTSLSVPLTRKLAQVHYSLYHYCTFVNNLSCRNGVVGIPTRYGFEGPRFGHRWGAWFALLVQTGPGTHLASCTMGARIPPGVKRPRRGVDHPPPPSATVKDKSIDIRLLQVWVFMACSRVNFTVLFVNNSLLQYLFSLQ
jgi:hypothetical protein